MAADVAHVQLLSADQLELVAEGDPVLLHAGSVRMGPMILCPAPREARGEPGGRVEQGLDAAAAGGGGGRADHMLLQHQGCVLHTLQGGFGEKRCCELVAASSGHELVAGAAALQFSRSVTLSSRALARRGQVLMQRQELQEDRGLPSPLCPIFLSSFSLNPSPSPPKQQNTSK